MHNDDETITEPETPPADAELDAARAILAAMRRPVADTWRHTARTQLETAGTRLDRRTVEIRAARLATDPTNGAATA